MKTKLTPTLGLAALLTLAAAPFAVGMDHGSMGHGSMDHGGGQPAAAAQQARHGVEIRKTVVDGYALAYNLIDMTAMMKETSMPMTHGGEKMKSHHLMVYPVGPDGKAVTNAAAGYYLVGPDKVEAKVMAMLMGDGFGADVDLLAKGDYTITTKIAIADKKLVDEFHYTVH